MPSNIITTSRQALYLFGLFCLPAAGFFAPISVSGLNISIVAAALCCILSGHFFEKFQEIKKNPLVISILLIVVFAALSTLWGIASWNEKLSALHKYDKLLYFIFLAPLCLEKNTTSRLGLNARNTAINAFLAAMTLTVALSFLKQYAGLTYGKHPTDATWIFHSHIETSYFVAFSAYIFIYRAIYFARLRGLYGALFLLFTWQEFFINDGRTGWVVYLFLVVLFFAQFSLKRSLNNDVISSKQVIANIFKGISLGLLVSTLLTLALYTLSDKVQISVKSLEGEYSATQTTEIRPTSIGQRIGFIHTGIAMTKEHPLVGMGPGSFPKTFEKMTGFPNWGHPHNEYLLMLVHFGLIGLALLLYFFYVQWKITFRYINDWPIAQALVFSFMLGACYNAFLFTTVTGNFYVLFLALFFYNPFTKISARKIPY